MIILVVWNILLSFGMYKLMGNPSFTYYTIQFDKYGVWIFKTWVGASGSGSGKRIFKWKFWIKD